MWIVAALAFMPLAAISFGALALLVAIMPEATHNLSLGASLLLGAAAVSVIISLPLSVVVARRMTTPQDRRLLRG